MVGGGSDLGEISNRLGLPADLIGESERFKNQNGDIYPDNAQIVMVFDDIKTQWRVGGNGVIGLDYNVLPVIFDTRGIEQKEYVLEGIKIMERAAIKEIRRNK